MIYGSSERVGSTVGKMAHSGVPMIYGSSEPGIAPMPLRPRLCSNDLWEFGAAARKLGVPRLHPSPKLFYHSSHSVVKGLVGGEREDASPADWFFRGKENPREIPQAQFSLAGN